MAKYYVQSGPFQLILSAPHIETAEDAAIEAVLIGAKRGSYIAEGILVSERGFDFFAHNNIVCSNDLTDSTWNDHEFKTQYILRKAGIDEC